MNPRLSSPITALRDYYPVVVVGSGYGASIAASRLARTGQKVCVLERGLERRPGSYPGSASQFASAVQVHDAHTGKSLGSPTDLFDVRLSRQINVLVGCGLGGTSLINANVVERPSAWVFAHPCWPEEIRNEGMAGLAPYFERAEEMLAATAYPESRPALAKAGALARSAETLKGPLKRPRLAVTFEDKVNHVGVEQHACTLCGDCVSGCNHGAKNTLLMNYLPDAVNHGAEIFTAVQVTHVERAGDRWRVHFHLRDHGREAFDSPPLFVFADVVVLGAGALGSTEILLRSQAAGLSTSHQLGEHFTGNGDVLGFGYNCDEPIHGIGWGADPDPDERPTVGPCISSMIDLRGRPDIALEDEMVIEEGSIPGALSAFLPATFDVAATIIGDDLDHGLADGLREAGRSAQSMVQGAHSGATAHTQTYLVMAHDDGRGTLRLDERDQLDITWEGYGEQPVFRRIHETLREATRPLGGTYMPNPTWTKLMSHRLVTVHPLGGCPMGADAGQGVVDHRGQVYAGPQGKAVHDGLYVVDGAIIPRPVGINPLLTISALSERASEWIARDHGWGYGTTLPSQPRTTYQAPRTGVRFTETMRGWFSTEVKDADYERAWKAGAEDASPFEFTLTISVNDLEAHISEPEHRAAMVGTVKCPVLSDKPLTVTEGVFNLFVKSSTEAEAREMWYRMMLTADDGRRWHFTGFKTVRDDDGFDLWADTTTLYITVREDSENGPVLGCGKLRIEAADFAKQLTTMQVFDAPEGEAVSALARFGVFFMGPLYETYVAN